jgi:hypothetical protein
MTSGGTDISALSPGSIREGFGDGAATPEAA